MYYAVGDGRFFNKSSTLLHVLVIVLFRRESEEAGRGCGHEGESAATIGEGCGHEGEIERAGEECGHQAARTSEGCGHQGEGVARPGEGCGHQGESVVQMRTGERCDHLRVKGVVIKKENKIDKSFSTKSIQYM